MNEPKHFQIPIETPLVEFQKHLENPDNHRIYFNGKFGTGKTYFLNKFFESNEEYNVIHLYPVNYQVSSNEDIFELIKYDILLDLINFGWFEEKEELTKKLALQSYIINEGGKTVLKMLKCIPKIGKAIEAGESLIKFISSFREYQSELITEERDFVTEFISNLPDQAGTIYEYDQISQIIRTVIEEKGDDKLCLVIDDIDRIDPEHIFRILNVFTAHFDLGVDHENKFGFSKIILVGDIDNIRNIFKAKYGMNADFNGYVDKFYSKVVFNFDNKTEIAKEVQRLLHEYIQNNNVQNTRIKNIINEYILYVIYHMILAGTINLRDLQKMFSVKYDWGRINKLLQSDLEGARPCNFEAPYIVDFLFFLFEFDLNKFYEVLDRSSIKCIDDKINSQILSQLLVFYYHENLIFKENENETVIIDEESQLKINVSRHRWNLRGHYYQAYLNEDNNLSRVSNKRLFKLIKDVHSIVYSFQERERIMVR